LSVKVWVGDPTTALGVLSQRAHQLAGSQLRSDLREALFLVRRLSAWGRAGGAAQVDYRRSTWSTPALRYI
jgi:hypothetical protein